MARLTIQLSDEELKEAIASWLCDNNFPYENPKITLQQNPGDADPRCYIAPYVTVLVEVDR